MSDGEWFIVIGLGGLFILLGLAAFIRGRIEEKDYYNSISTRPDTRQFLEHKPERPEPGALRIGGWLAIAIGVLMLIMSGAFLLWG